MNIVVTEWNWPNGIELLEVGGFEVRYDPDMWRKPGLLRELEHADALIVRNQTLVNGELIRSAPRLKVIGRLGVGLDNIDLAAAAARGIPVIAARNANAASVAEYVMAAMLDAGRGLVEAADSVRRGEWDRRRHTRTELGGKTLGLIGAGEIGHRTAARAKAFGMRVLGYDPKLSAYDYPVTETGVVPASMEEVLRESDYVSLHVPLVPATRHLIRTESLALMKPTAVLINTSRGGVVDERALYEALAAGRLGGAYLDVLEKEPPDAGNPLIGLPGCRVTPHIAGLTEESQERTAALVSREIMAELAGSPSICRV